MLGAQLNANFNAAGALAILGDVADSLTAAGAGASTAYAITATTSVFTTVASGTGCILPISGKGDRFHVANLGANALTIYPPTGGSLNGASSVSLPVSSAVDIVCRNTTQFTYDAVVSSSYAGPTIGASVATTSGATVSIASGIASTITGIDIDLRGVSTNGTSALGLKLGIGSGIDSSSYIVQYSSSTGGTVTNANNVAAGMFLLMAVNAAAADTHYGRIQMRLIETSTNTWAIVWTIGAMTRSTISWGTGQKALSGALTQLQLTTSAGADTFDAGSVIVTTY